MKLHRLGGLIPKYDFGVYLLFFDCFHSHFRHQTLCCYYYYYFPLIHFDFSFLDSDHSPLVLGCRWINSQNYPLDVHLKFHYVCVCDFFLLHNFVVVLRRRTQFRRSSYIKIKPLECFCSRSAERIKIMKKTDTPRMKFEHII